MARIFGTFRVDLRLDFAHGRPNNNAMHHRWPDMIYEVGSMKSFAAIYIILAFWGHLTVSWRSVMEKFRTFSRIAVMLMSDKETRLHH